MASPGSCFTRGETCAVAFVAGHFLLLVLGDPIRCIEVWDSLAIANHLLAVRLSVRFKSARRIVEQDLPDNHLDTLFQIHELLAVLGQGRMFLGREEVLRIIKGLEVEY